MSFAESGHVRIVDEEERRVFGLGMTQLNRAGIEYLVAGAYAECAYTGLWRNTNDLDVFMRARDVKAALDGLAEAGFETRVVDGRWLAKALWGDYLIDIIFAMSNGVMPVSDDWYAGAEATTIAGVEACLIPIEELIAAKVYVALRDRFDGADIVHLIRHSRGQLDWQRILDRLDGNRELLLWYLMMFDFVYPGLSDYLPKELMQELLDAIRQRWQRGADPLEFRGTLLDPESFAIDVEDWGYRDQRNLRPLVGEHGELL